MHQSYAMNKCYSQKKKKKICFWWTVYKLSRAIANGTGQKVQRGEMSSSRGPDGKKAEKEGERLAKEKPDKPSADKKKNWR